MTLAMNPDTVLEVRNLSVAYRQGGGWSRAVDDVSFALKKGEVFGLVGESGCGKSTVSLQLLGYRHPSMRAEGGAVLFKDQNLLKLTRPELDRLVGDTRQPVLILFGAVSLLLLIACANTANLLLARTADREREFAVRLAIGAASMRVVRQLLTENSLLSLLGGTAGVAVAWSAVHLGLRFAGKFLLRAEDITVDARVLAFTKVIGGGQTTSVKFSTAALKKGEAYTYFCSFPGHSAIMKGTFKFN